MAQSIIYPTVTLLKDGQPHLCRQDKAQQFIDNGQGFTDPTGAFQPSANQAAATTPAPSLVLSDEPPKGGKKDKAAE